ncbi:hypothetical protein NCCP2050_08320 [Planococcus sp. NCCP-2050]|nr:hypothetical protein NCCP2050_08320 [Planococcus sp. NCCP-2050]
MEKRKQPYKFDGHKTNCRSGGLCRTGDAAYDLRTWLLESGHRKAEPPCEPRPALEAFSEMAVFAIADKAEATSSG